MQTLREAAFFALTGSKFIEDTLLEWQEKDHPSQKDFNLAFEIANGTCRRKLTLDALAKKRCKLPKKKRERALLEMTLYQLYFLERVPIYAVVSESVEIAKKHISVPFSKFINATFRSFEKEPIEFFKDLSTRYSYPPYFVDALVKERGLDTAEEVLDAMNRIYPVHARVRKTQEIIEVANPKEAAKETSLYIQNGTYILLLEKLSSYLKKAPQSILDMAAAPGGKLIALHDRFPAAILQANDIRIDQLQSNLKKYDVSALISEGPAQALNAAEKFDLIVCDLPCSNTGVLHKRPEARWRLTSESLKELETLQLEILEKAKTLLKPDGQIWYMTCSILREENELIASKSGLQKLFEITHLPNNSGYDGGYGCILVL